MDVNDQTITDRYALYNGDCCEVLPTLPSEIGRNVGLFSAVLRVVQLFIVRQRHEQLRQLRAVLRALWISGE